jgi:hypothetical protein
MPSTNSAPCPICKAMNFDHRRECWKCKRTLPVSHGIDAKRFTAAHMQRTSGPLPPLPEQVAKQMKAPQGRDKPAEQQAQKPAETTVDKGKRIGWMLIKPLVKGV